MKILIIARGYPTPNHPLFGCFEATQAHALQKLGHTIRIQSEIGEGTVVTVGFYKDTIDVRD